MTDQRLGMGHVTGLTLISTGDVQTSYSLVDKIRQHRAVRVVRGSEMRTWDALFAEMSSSFQFFAGFGWNLDALFECLTDPELRYPHDTHLGLIVAAEEVLCEEQAGELEKFTRCLNDASQMLDESADRSNIRAKPVMRFVVVPYIENKLDRKRWTNDFEMREERVNDVSFVPPFIAAIIDE